MAEDRTMRSYRLPAELIDEFDRIFHALRLQGEVITKDDLASEALRRGLAGFRRRAEPTLGERPGRPAA
jgi:hypothetical protein